MQIKRDGIFFEVDLTEGIDLNLFLFGGFQQHIIESRLINLKQDATIFDIGANCGILSLQLAKAAPQGHIYSFEPTHYAYKKLRQNIKLNPQLASRITTTQTFITDKTQKEPHLKAYSSWKIAGSKGKNTHPVHLGTVKGTQGINAISIDSFCKTNRIKKLDFIKIDTDGHEAEVLNGAVQSVTKYRPVIVFEVGDYLLKERGINFLFFLNYFQKLNYSLIDIDSKRRVTKKNYHILIPPYSTTDILALPKKSISQRL